MDAPLKPSINRSFPARQGAASSTKRLCRPNRGCKLLNQLMYFSIVCRERTALRIGKTLGSCGGERASPIGLPFSALADLPRWSTCQDFLAQMNLVLSMLFDPIEDL